jgi:prolyl oligopeptidase
MIFLSTSNGYPSGRIITLDSTTFDSTAPDSLLNVSTLVPQDPEGHVLRSAHLVADSILILVYLRHACAAIEFIDANTGEKIGSTTSSGTYGHVEAKLSSSIPVPEDEISYTNDQSQPTAVVIPNHASISAVSSRSDAKDFYLAVDTFVAPPYILAGKITPGDGDEEPEIILNRLEGKVKSEARHDDLICRQEFYQSHDGVRIPIFICHANDLDLSRPQPVLLHAYGGFGVSLLPHYDPFFCSFMRDLKGM